MSIVLRRPRIHILMNQMMRVKMEAVTQHPILTILGPVLAKRHVRLGALIAVISMFEVHYVWSLTSRVSTAFTHVVSVVRGYHQVEEFADLAALVGGLVLAGGVLIGDRDRTSLIGIAVRIKLVRQLGVKLSRSGPQCVVVLFEFVTQEMVISEPHVVVNIVDYECLTSVFAL